MKRFMAYATSALLGVGGLIAVAAPASAHHSTITASVQCAAGNDYTITWSVRNWDSGAQNLIGKVTSSSRGVVPVDTAFADDEVKTFDETVTGKQNLGLDVSMKWNNGVTATNHGSLGTTSFPDCAQGATAAAPSVNPPTCESDGTLSVPADTASIDYSQDPAGSGPGTYDVTATAKAGYKLNGTTHWSVTVLSKLAGVQCDEVVSPVAPSVVAIDECDEFGVVTFAATEGVTYELTSGNGITGEYTVTASAQPGYTFADGAQTVFTGDLGAHQTCVTAPVPVEVEPTCDTPGSVNLPTATGVTYKVEDLGDGVFKVVVAPEAGYEVVGATEWTIDTKSQLAGHECDEIGTPVAPLVDDIDECGEFGSISLGDTTQATYTLTAGDGKQGAYEVTAAPVEGYTFEDGAQTVFTGDLGTHTNCAAAAADLDDRPLPDTGAATSLLILLMIGSTVAVGAVLIAASRQPVVAAERSARRIAPLAMLRGTRGEGARPARLPHRE